MRMIKLSEPVLDVDIESDIAKALERKEVGYVGSFIDDFKEKLVDFVGHPHIHFFSSGTASLHLALRLAGVGPGDEVLCQSFTFAASANPVVYLGAQPVFVGSEGESWNMCPKYLEKALAARIKSGKTVKAIVPVHLYGMPAKMKEIRDVASSYGIPVIEDAAEALGASIDGRFCGTFGDFGVYSFNANKIITTGGGGALLAMKAEELRRAVYYALQAKDPAPHYQHSQLGYNYAFSNLNAVLGNAQMDKLRRNIERRREVYEMYADQLSAIDGVEFQLERAGVLSNRWLTAILLPKNGLSQKLKVYLDRFDIESRPLWKPMHLQPFYQSNPYYGDKLEEGIFERGLCLPSGSGLSRTQVETVGRCIHQFLKDNR